MDPSIKQLLNKLSCPLCGEQIDISLLLTNVYVCSYDSNHYNINIICENDTPIITKETIKCFDTKLLYFIIKKYNYDSLFLSYKISTKISQFSTDLENRVLDNVPVKSISFDYDVLENVTKDKILKRIRTLLLLH